MKRIRWVGALALLLVVLSGLSLAVFFVWRDVTSWQDERSFQDLLDRVDEMLSSGKTVAAETLLANMDRDLPRTSAGWLRVLKRAYLVGERGGDYSVLLDLGREAGAEYPGQARIWLLLIHALLSAGRPEEAMEVAWRHLPPSDYRYVFQSLWHALLEQHAEEFSVQRIQRMGRLLPFLLDPDVYLSLGEELDDESFTMRGVLLLLRRDRAYHEAARILADLSGETARDLLVYILYDAGVYEEVVERSEDFLRIPTPERLHLVAESFWHTGRVTQASALYRHLIAAFPRHDPRAYHNLLVSLLEERRLEEGEEVLEAGLRAFPGDGLLLRDRVRLLLFRGEEDEARILAASLDDPFARIVSLLLEGRTHEPFLLRGEVWEMIEGHTGEEAAWEYGAWFFSSHGFWDDLEELLESGFGLWQGRTWYRFYRGLVLLKRGNREGAKRLLSEVEGDYRAAALYDLALILGEEGRYREGAELLTRAPLETFPQEEQLDLLTLRAWLLAASGSTGEARALLRQVLSVNPGTVDAAVLLRKLE